MMDLEHLDVVQEVRYNEALQCKEYLFEGKWYRKKDLIAHLHALGLLPTGFWASVASFLGFSSFIPRHHAEQRDDVQHGSRESEFSYVESCDEGWEETMDNEEETEEEEWEDNVNDEYDFDENGENDVEEYVEEYEEEED